MVGLGKCILWNSLNFNAYMISTRGQSYLPFTNYVASSKLPQKNLEEIFKKTD